MARFVWLKSAFGGGKSDCLYINQSLIGHVGYRENTNKLSIQNTPDNGQFANCNRLPTLIENLFSVDETLFRQRLNGEVKKGRKKLKKCTFHFEKMHFSFSRLYSFKNY